MIETLHHFTELHSSNFARRLHVKRSVRCSLYGLQRFHFLARLTAVSMQWYLQHCVHVTIPLCAQILRKCKVLVSQSNILKGELVLSASRECSWERSWYLSFLCRNHKYYTTESVSSWLDSSFRSPREIYIVSNMYKRSS